MGEWGGVTAYQQGRNFEWKVRDDLAANGYEVIRAAGSKGGSKVDLIGLKPGQMCFVQCKANGVIPPAEWNRLVEVSGWVGAVPLLAANGPRGRGVVYIELVGRKVPRARLVNQACRIWHPDQIAASA